MLSLAPTPRAVVLHDGAARLLHFRGGRDPEGRPVLLVPSMINRWTVLDLCPGASVVQALLDHGLDVFCLDWGTPGDEDRYLEWDDVVARLQRAIRKVRRLTGAPSVGLLGYSMGATLATIVSALEPSRIGALVCLAGPIDFSKMGTLGVLTDPRWLDAEAVAAAGNVHPAQIRAGLIATRPTDQVAKWLDLAESMGDPQATRTWWALQTWVNDNIRFPAAVYRRWVRDLCQRNELVQGLHHIAGRRVDLSAIHCPVLTVVAERDAICPPAASVALAERVSSERARVLKIPGSHIGSVVGPNAARDFYPQLGEWLRGALCS